jgi:hypothetical protein
MLVLIHKTSLVRLGSSLRINRLRPGDPVQLRKEGDVHVAAYIMLPSRLPFRIGNNRFVRAGHLNNRATSLLLPAFVKSANLKARIVEILEPHHNREASNCISISVWGDPVDIIPIAPRASIF